MSYGKESCPEEVPGGGPQGAYLGNIEYIAQSNESANCLKKKQIGLNLLMTSPPKNQPSFSWNGII